MGKIVLLTPGKTQRGEANFSQKNWWGGSDPGECCKNILVNDFKKFTKLLLIALLITFWLNKIC